MAAGPDHHEPMARFTFQLLLLLLLAGAVPLAAKPTFADVARRAEQGNAKAQFTLGEMYETGDGVLQDGGAAAKWYRLAAAQGNVRAQTALGYLYSVGLGVPQDSAEAVKWYRLAADRGNATAQYNLGLKYAAGEGVPQDQAEAAKWYRAAADQGQGHAKARYNLGVMYETGTGVPRDPAEAQQWYRKAAELNNAKAESNLGHMYATGAGVRRDPAEAAHWYRRAAEHGDPTAQYNLGVMTAAGDGVTKDLVQAHAWLDIAGSQGSQDVRPKLAAIERDMTVEQKTAAKQLALPAAGAARGRTSGWYAVFQPAKGARFNYDPDHGGFQESEDLAACRYGIWVPLTGPEGEVEIISGGRVPAGANPEAFRATILQRSDDMVVLKLVPKAGQPPDRVQIYTIFPKLGAGFLTTAGGKAPGSADPTDSAVATDGAKAGALVTPLTKVE